MWRVPGAIRRRRRPVLLQLRRAPHVASPTIRSRLLSPELFQPIDLFSWYVQLQRWPYLLVQFSKLWLWRVACHIDSRLMQSTPIACAMRLRARCKHVCTLASVMSSTSAT